MNVFEHLTSVLNLPIAYRLFGWGIGVRHGRRIYLERYIKPAPGAKVLDIGCGPADILAQLPEVDYLGVDISPDYIQSAKGRFGSKGRFLCQDVGRVAIEKEHGTFDLALATGLLHHLNDDGAAKLFCLAQRALRPGGSLVTLDGCFSPRQSRAAQWLLERDRGKFVRTVPEYARLASVYFTKVEPSVRQDLLRIPYTHLIMRCSN
jgi:SAM-dependent methyltransferase